MVKPVSAPVVVRSGWCAGLSFQIARVLLEAGYQSKPQARTAVMDGRLSPDATPGLASGTYLALCDWLRVSPPAGQPTESEVAAAVALLERAGYAVQLSARHPVIDG